MLISLNPLAKLVVYNLSSVWFGLSIAVPNFLRHISEQCRSVSEMFATQLSKSKNGSMTYSLITCGLIVHVEDKRSYFLHG